MLNKMYFHESLTKESNAHLSHTAHAFTIHPLVHVKLSSQLSMNYFNSSLASTDLMSFNQRTASA